MKGERLVAQARVQAEAKNFEEAYELLLRASAMGNSEAIYATGTWYLHGIHVDQNIFKSVQYFQSACRLNHPTACFDIAICLENGEGIEKNAELAFEHYVKAALWGHKGSLFEVHRCLYYGIGTKENKDLANIWLDRYNESQSTCMPPSPGKSESKKGK
jgi:TPR repeat protein